jgi:putative transposase
MRQPYSTDVTDDQWHILHPRIPPATPGGHPRPVDMRAVLHTLFDQNRTGCQWDRLPHDLLPTSPGDDSCSQGRDDGTWHQRLDTLREAVRQQAGRPPAPRAGRLDAQTVQGTAGGGERGAAGHTQVHGRKRPSMVDPRGLLLAVVVTAAAADDGTAAPQVLATWDAHTPPRLARLGADHQDDHRTLDRGRAAPQGGDRIAVGERPVGAPGWVLLPRRWGVERPWAGLGRYRRNSKDSERLTASSAATVKGSMIPLMRRRLRPDKAKQTPAFTSRRTPRKAA